MRRFLFAALAWLLCAALLPLPVLAESPEPVGAEICRDEPGDDAFPEGLLLELEEVEEPEPDEADPEDEVLFEFGDDDADEDADDGDENVVWFSGDAEEPEADAPAEEQVLELEDALRPKNVVVPREDDSDERFLDEVDDELADPDGTGPESIEETASLADAALDNDTLFQGYITRALGRRRDASYYAGYELEGTAWLLYNALREQVEAVADGRRTSTEFTFTAEELGIGNRQFTAAELGMYSFRQYGLLDALTGVGDVMHALLYDCPYDLYWFDKTVQMHMPAVITRGGKGAGEVRGLVSITIQMPVAGAYASGPYALNTSLPARVRAAAENVGRILDASGRLENYEKLASYRAAICDLVCFDTSAAAEALYGDPWQLVYVFDGDAATNVVCEGYSKAFKFLCDQSDFSGDVSCILVTGSMDGNSVSGEHMWNVVRMPDGKNYLVDVTNCDAGTVGSPDLLFMRGSGDGDPEKGVYRIPCGRRTITYTYDLGTRDTHAKKRLALAGRDYNAAQPDPAPTPTPEPAAPLRVTGFGGRIDKIYDGGTGAAAPEEGLLADGEPVDDIVQVLSVTFDRAGVGEDIPCTLKLAVRKDYVGRYALAEETLRAAGNVLPRPVEARYVGQPLEKFYDGTAEVGVRLTDDLLAFDGLADEDADIAWDPELRFDSAETGDRTATVTFAMESPLANNYVLEPLVIPGRILSRAIVGFDYVDAPETHPLSGRPTAAEIARRLPDTLVAQLYPEEERVTVEGVTWTCVEYDAGATGAFAFIAGGDPGDCALASGVLWPVHVVNITMDAPAAEPEAEAPGEAEEPRDIGGGSVTVDPIPAQGWTGAEVRPILTVRDGEEPLAEGADYAVAFRNNVERGDAAVAILTGVGRYTGSREVIFRIAERVKSVLRVGHAGLVRKVYDGTTACDADLGLTCEGLMDGDALGDVVAATARFDSPNAGEDKSVIVDLALNPAWADRYELPVTTLVFRGIIEKAPLIVSVPPVRKVYDGTVDAQIGVKGVRVWGAVNGEAIAVTGITARFADRNAGRGKAVRWVANATGNLDNYRISGGTVSGSILSGVSTGDISKRPIDLIGLAQARKTYDGTKRVPDSATCGAMLSGVVSGDNVNVTVSASYDDEGAGTGKTVTYASVLSGVDRGNYTVNRISPRTDGVIEQVPADRW